jgi:hypothetical protein
MTSDPACPQQRADSLAAMGYDLHITRAELWFESNQPPISQAEWPALVDRREDLRPVGSDVIFDIAESIRIPMWWRNGQITINKPFGRDNTLHEQVTNALAQLATDINARLQGDDGEVYERQVDQDSIQPAGTSD